LDIVFATADEDEDSFKEYFNEMPWKAIPFSEKDRVRSLGEKYPVDGIPSLIVLSATCEVISNDNVDYCETCVKEIKHEHSLIECLQPDKQYSIEQIFKTVPHLLQPKSDEHIETNTLWQDDVQSVGVYFSAHWCPPCRGFTPELAKLYKEAQEKSSAFRIVFVSLDRDEESFNEYRGEMPWPAVPLNAGGVLKNYFQFRG